MSSNMVIAAAVLERLRHSSFSETNYESQLMIDKVNDELLPVREQLKQIMEVSDANPNTTDDQAKNFRKIMRLCCDLEDLMESYLREIASRRIWNQFRNMIFKRSSWQQIKVIERLREELASMMSSDQLAASNPSAGTTPLEEKDHPLPLKVDDVTDETIVRKQDAERLVSVLTDRSTYRLDIVSICGMGGIGKTTLARTLIAEPRIACHFNVCAWVAISPEFRRKAVFRDILACTSDTRFERRDAAMDKSDVDLAELVYKSLKGRRYLIVLDDIWSNDVWLGLRMAFPDDNNGSRVLITTRIMGVANQAGGHIHTIRSLNEQETWELFRHKLRVDETEFNAKEKFKLIGREIARLCRGWPLAVVLAAGLLSGTPLNRWEELAEKFSAWSTVEDFHPIIELSYQYLPLYLKPCLLYLGHFLKDTAIELDTVCQFWIAEGLISMENISNGETMMDVAARYLNELVNQSLVITEDQDSRQKRFKSFRIHDIIRDYCIYKGTRDGIFEVIPLRNENQNMSSTIIRRAIHLDEFEYIHSPLYGHADYLRSLLFFTSYKSEEGIIRPREIPHLDNFLWLRVLYLYGVDFADGKLPRGVEKLVYLRYLGFMECYLEELSSLVSNMCYLQTLDLRVRNECEMTILNVFNGCKRLKYLYFPLAYRTLNHEDKLRLAELKELEILHNFDAGPCNAEDLCLLTNLKELTVTTEGDVSEIEKVMNALEKNTSEFRSISLNIRNFDCYSSKRLSAIKKVFNSSALHVLEVEGHLGKLPVFDRTSSKLTEVILNGSELVEDPMQILQELPNLAILVLEMEAYNEEFMHCSSYGFRALKHLKLHKLYKLKSWTVEEGAMPSLSILVIENCKNLQMLPAGLKYCKMLRKLEITSMSDAFVGRIQKSDGTEGEDFQKIEKAQPDVIIDGQILILKKRQQGPREDPQCSSTL